MNANKQTSWQLCIYDYRIWWKIWLLPKFTSEVQLSEIVNKRNVVLGYYSAYHALMSATWIYSMPCVHLLFFLHYVKVTNKPNVAGYAYCTIVVYVVSILVTIIKKKSNHSENDSHHCNDVIMGAITSQITSLTIIYSTVYSDADHRKHQSSASLAFARGIHRGIPHTNGQ